MFFGVCWVFFCVTCFFSWSFLVFTVGNPFALFPRPSKVFKKTEDSNGSFCASRVKFWTFSP